MKQIPFAASVLIFAVLIFLFAMGLNFESESAPSWLNKQNDYVLLLWVKDSIPTAVELVKVLGGITLAYGFYNISLNRKKFNFEVMLSCIDRFNAISEKMTSRKNSGSFSAYISLVNEELFYFSQNYIPRQVAKEWVDGMIDTLPIRDKKTNEIINEGKSHFNYKGHEDIYENHPRIAHCFVWDAQRIEDIYSDNIDKKRKAREKLIKSILKKVNEFSY